MFLFSGLESRGESDIVASMKLKMQWIRWLCSLDTDHVHVVGIPNLMPVAVCIENKTFNTTFVFIFEQVYSGLLIQYQMVEAKQTIQVPIPPQIKLTIVILSV